MRCSYFKKEIDEDRQTGVICSCELGYFEDENQKTAIEEHCTGCEDKETDSPTADDEDEEEDI
jgi:hypothetical protein